MNIRELDEESRRTGVWPPRRIILRVEPEGDDAEGSPDGRSGPVKVGEVDLSAPPARAAAPAPAPAAPAPSPSPSASASRPPASARRGVTPAAAPTPSAEDAEFDKWLAEPLAPSEPDPEYQAAPEWLPEYRRVHAERRHRRVTRKARAQLFGASAATTLAVGGCAAALALVGLSQTETVGGSLGVPSIGLFGTSPDPPSRNETADSATPKPAAKKAAKKPDRKPARREARRESAAPPPRNERPRRTASDEGPRSAPAPAARRRAPARRSTPAAPRQPARTVNPSPPPPPRAVSPPPPPPRAASPPPPSPSPRPRVPVAPSRPAGSTPSQPAPPPPPTSSSPALDSGPEL